MFTFMFIIINIYYGTDDKCQQGTLIKLILSLFQVFK